VAGGTQRGCPSPLRRFSGQEVGLGRVEINARQIRSQHGLATLGNVGIGREGGIRFAQTVDLTNEGTGAGRGGVKRRHPRILVCCEVVHHYIRSREVVARLRIFVDGVVVRSAAEVGEQSVVSVRNDCATCKGLFSCGLGHARVDIRHPHGDAQLQRVAKLLPVRH